MKQEHDLLKLHTVQYGVYTFHVLTKKGEVSDKITKQVTDRISNIKEGFSSPGHFKETNVIRLHFGCFHTTKKHIKAYFEKIVEAAREEREKPE